MSWRDKLKIAYLETRDTSDRSRTFVTSVIDSLTNPDALPSGALERTPEPSGAVDGADRGIPWAEWKASTLNQLFKEQGVTGQLGRITAATMRHGESIRDRVDSVATPERPMSPAEATQ